MLVAKTDLFFPKVGSPEVLGRDRLSFTVRAFSDGNGRASLQTTEAGPKFPVVAPENARGKRLRFPLGSVQSELGASEVYPVRWDGCLTNAYGSPAMTPFVPYD